MPFVKGKSGNPEGKPKGAKAKKTLQWEALAESILGEQADSFNSFLNELWSSEKMSERIEAARLYLQAAEYFKPKQSRITAETDSEVTVIVRHES